MRERSKDYLMLKKAYMQVFEKFRLHRQRLVVAFSQFSAEVEQLLSHDQIAQYLNGAYDPEAIIAWAEKQKLKSPLRLSELQTQLQFVSLERPRFRTIPPCKPRLVAVLKPNSEKDAQ